MKKFIQAQAERTMSTEDLMSEAELIGISSEETQDIQTRALVAIAQQLELIALIMLDKNGYSYDTDTA